MGQIFPWKSGNRFELLIDGPQFFPIMLTAIARAEHQVALELYLVEDGRTALLVPPADPQALAQAVLRLWGQPALADGLREAGLRQVQQYTWTQVRPRLLDVYRSVMNK